jgi:hypothetical protein
VHRLIFANQQLAVGAPSSIKVLLRGQYQTLKALAFASQSDSLQYWPQRRNALRVFHAGTGTIIHQLLGRGKNEQCFY